MFVNNFLSINDKKYTRNDIHHHKKRRKPFAMLGLRRFVLAGYASRFFMPRFIHPPLR